MKSRLRLTQRVYFKTYWAAYGCNIKGIFHPTNKNSVIIFHIFPNPYDFFSSVEHKRWIYGEYSNSKKEKWGGLGVTNLILKWFIWLIWYWCIKVIPIRTNNWITNDDILVSMHFVYCWWIMATTLSTLWCMPSWEESCLNKLDLVNESFDPIHKTDLSDLFTM